MSAPVNSPAVKERRKSFDHISLKNLSNQIEADDESLLAAANPEQALTTKRASSEPFSYPLTAEPHLPKPPKVSKDEPRLDEITASPSNRHSPARDSVPGEQKKSDSLTDPQIESADEEHELHGMGEEDVVKRNPKRKATEVATPLPESSENLLTEALAPISQEDIREWDGWCELESEPAFFNVILQKYGVKNAKIQEIFSIDDDSLALLPQPVHGLIFLYQYFSEDYEALDELNGKDVWFANQTTDNACATVAMMNIVMNSDLELGPELQAFKEATANMGFALRGYSLAANRHIRAIHNSLTRRLDHLNVDLSLGATAQAYQKNAKKRKAAPAKSSGGAPAAKKTKTAAQPKKRRKVDSETGFHFIAIVPANGHVWELDGLKPNPVKLGPITEAGWVAAAKPSIEARMFQFEEGEVHFNMMALCKSPLAIASEKLAQSIVHLEMLKDRVQDNDGLQAHIACNPQPIFPGEDLARYGLDKEAIKQAKADPDTAAKIKNKVTTPAELADLYDEVIALQKMTGAEYRDEMAGFKVEEHMVAGRKKDNMLAVHRWLEALASQDVLETMLEGWKP